MIRGLYRFIFVSIKCVSRFFRHATLVLLLVINLLTLFQCIILATRPIMLHTLRLQVASSTTSSSSVPTTAIALSAACVRCAKNSVQLLTQSWIDGSFITFDCFFTRYLFASLVVLAVSSILDGQDNKADRDIFTQASQLLTDLKDAGNCVAQEYCHHIAAIEISLSEYTNAMMTSGPVEGPEISTLNTATEFQVPENTPQDLGSTAGVPWSYSSLHQLLSHPALDIQFLEDAIRDTYSQDFHQLGQDDAI